MNLSSNAHWRSNVLFDDPMFTAPGSYSPWTAYGQSKTANILHAVELNKRLSASGVTAVALHPGVIETELWRHAGPVAKMNKTIPQVRFCRVCWCRTRAWVLGMGCTELLDVWGAGCGFVWDCTRWTVTLLGLVLLKVCISFACGSRVIGVAVASLGLHSPWQRCLQS